jgi:hypothetical protein
MALINPEDAYPGRIVYLYPNTKTAGQWCWRKKTAVVIDTHHWPRVHVELEDKGQTHSSHPHRLDVMLRPTGSTVRQEKKDGDMAGSGMAGTKVRVIPGKAKYEMNLGDDVEQPGLW